MKIQERVKNGWNAFMNKDPTMPPKQEQIFESFIYEGSMSSNSAIIHTKSRDQSLVDAINNRLALDAAAIDIQHCYVDEDERFIDMVPES
jgi:Tat protein secretion system quality control protein TatD with DNase activity